MQFAQTTPLEDAVREAQLLVAPYIVGRKKVSIRVAALRHILSALETAGYPMPQMNERGDA